MGTDRGPVRYAVVGAGWISQIAFLPGVDLTGNSRTTALVSGNAGKAGRLAAFHGIDHVCSYEDYDAMLAADIVDAVYIALPNSLHADYAIRAARAGKHIMVEKPLAVTVQQGEAMITAAQDAGVYLMTAYRLHNEPGTVHVLEQVRGGAIGDPRIFSSVFCFQAGADNHRLKAAHWGGPLQDIGIYCLNAARHVFQSEPVAVMATTNHVDDPRFSEVEETIAATLMFPRGRVAQFCASFGAAPLDTYRIAGTAGEIVVDCGYDFQTPTQVRMTRGADRIDRTFAATDQFAGETGYFSDCILNRVPPRADGAEGLADVRALLAIEAAARTGRPQPVDRPARPGDPDAGPDADAGPDTDMVRTIAPTTRRLMV